MPSRQTSWKSLKRHTSLLRGGSYDIAAAGNRPVLVYFLAPWCKFCAVSSDNLTRLRRLRADESLEILTVVLDYAFPTYYVLDSDRRIQRHDLGYSTQFGLWWRTWYVD